jgi:hypothetical protein
MTCEGVNIYFHSESESDRRCPGSGSMLTSRGAEQRWQARLKTLRTDRVIQEHFDHLPLHVMYDPENPQIDQWDRHSRTWMKDVIQKWST